MGMISITNCQGLPSNRFLSIQNTQNDLGSDTVWWMQFLSNFTKKINPKGSHIPLSISANWMSPANKSTVPSRDTSPVYHTSSSSAPEDPESWQDRKRGRSKRTWKTRMDQRLTNGWPILCHFWSIIMARISFVGHFLLLIYPSLAYLLILGNFNKYLYIYTCFSFVFQMLYQ